MMVIVVGFGQASTTIDLYPLDGATGIPYTTKMTLKVTQSSCYWPGSTFNYALTDLSTGNDVPCTEYYPGALIFRYTPYGTCYESVQYFHFCYWLKPDTIYRFYIQSSDITSTGYENTITFTTGKYPWDIPRGVFRNGEWIIDSNYNGIVDYRDHFGMKGDIPFMGFGDFGYENTLSVLRGPYYRGVFRNGEWIFDYNWDGIVDERNRFGMKGDIPLLYSLNGTESGQVRAVFRPSSYTNWIIDEGMDGSVDSRTHFGLSTDIPLMGTYKNNDPFKAVFRSGTWIWDDGMDGSVDYRISYGSSGDIPFFGDFDNYRTIDLGVFRKGEWIIDYKEPFGISDYRDRYGQTGDIPLYWWSTGYTRK